MIKISCEESNFSPSLAGDCVVVALWLPDGVEIPGVGDSKDLTEKQRLAVFAELQKHAIYSVQCATPADISRFGVYPAREMAAVAAVRALDDKLRLAGIGAADFVVSDTSLKKIAELVHKNSIAMVEAGRKDNLVAAASIVAKTYVDALLMGYSTFWPGYGIERNHGSVSAEHKAALREKGPTPVHRQGVYGKEWWRQLLGDPKNELAGGSN